MTGIVLSGTGIGALVGPPLANWFISIYDWRISYIIIGSIALVVIVLASQLLRRDPARMGLVPYGENKGGGQESKLGTEGFSLKEAVHTAQFWLVFAMFVCFGFSLFVVAVHIVPHAIELGISTAAAASILAAIGGMAIVGRLVLGSAADRIGNKQAFIIGFILMSAALFWLVPAKEVWRLYLFAIVFGFAHGGMGAQESPLLAGLFGLRSHGSIFGVAGVGFTIGAALGPVVAGYIFDVTYSYQLAFLISAAVIVVGLVLTAAIRPTRRGTGKAG